MAVAVRSGRDGRLPGRAHLEARLDAALDVARAASGGLRALVGPAGIGKSALALGLLQRARAAGVRTVRVAATAPDLEPPLGLWDRLLDDLALVDPAGVDAHLPGRSTGHGPAAPAPTHAAVLAALAVRPTLAVLEDIHAADVASLRLLTGLVPHLDGRPVLLVVTARAGAPHPDPEGRRLLDVMLGGGDVLEVPPLDDLGVAEFLAAAGRTDPVRDDVAALQAESGGNPWLLELLVAGVGGTDRQADPRGPDAVQTAMARRLTALPRSARRVLLALAVAGTDRDLVPVMAATSAGDHVVTVGDHPDRHDAEAVEAALTVLRSEGIVRPDGGLSHPAWGEIARRLGAAAEPAVRRALADVVAQGPLGDRDRLVRLRHLTAAAHLASADELVAAARAAVDAAGRLDDAVGEADAWEVLLDHGAAAMTGDLVAAGSAALRSGRRARGWALAARALRSADATDAPGRTAAALLMARDRDWDAGSTEAVAALVDTAARLTGHPRERALLLARAAELSVVVPNAPTGGRVGLELPAPMDWTSGQGATALLEAALEAAADDASDAVVTRVDLAWCHVRRGSEDAPARIVRCSAVAARPAAEGPDVAAALVRMAVDRLLVGDGRGAADARRRLAGLAASTGDAGPGWMSAVLDGTVARAEGRWAEAADLRARAADLGARADEAGRHVADAAALVGLASLLDGAVPDHLEGELAALRAAAPTLHPLLRAGLGALAARDATVAPAGCGPDELTALLPLGAGPGNEVLVAVLVAEAVAAARRPDLAPAVLAALAPHGDLVAVDVNGLHCHGSVGVAAARVAHLTGDVEAARRWAERGIEVDEGAGLVAHELTGRLLLVDLRPRGSDRAAAALALADEAARRGQPRIAARARRAADPQVAARIAGRRLAVLEGLAAGLTYDAIARRLGFSHGTVRKDVIAVYAALGAAGRDEAVAAAGRMGLVRVGPGSDGPGERHRS